MTLRRALSRLPAPEHRPAAAEPRQDNPLELALGASGTAP
jgi:hypothetical protein